MRVGVARRAGEVERAEALQAESRRLGEIEKTAEARAAGLSVELRDVLLRTPNTPDPRVPDGAGPDDNPVREVWVAGGGRFDEGAYAEHQRLPHWEVAAQQGWLDGERAVKLSGSMFTMYTGEGARLLRALTQLALDRHTAAGWTEVRPPTLVLTETMVSTGHLPKFADDAYHLERDDLWAIPTAEVPLTSMARDELLDEADLPRRYVAYTPCYRREAGSAGRDTRGLLRSHEFDKVEMMAVTSADQAEAVHADILAAARGLLEDLGLTYRVVDICTGDIGFSQALQVDLEVYSPGVRQWLEVSSVSWYSDFQARRANIRHRAAGGGTAVCHTCNGSALAWPRVWAALVETHRQPDGTMALPEVLRPFLGGARRLGRPRDPEVADAPLPDLRR
jgi:seryl-tRNA synthetase